ncbi:MAG: hypothetical protein ABWX82_12450, partial [Leifsonia sp.]
GSLLSAPFIANAATDQVAAHQETDALRLQNALDRSQLSIYADIAKHKAETDAAATITTANAVIASAASKVDASGLATSVSHLADYKLLSVGRIVKLTDDTRTAAEQTSAAVAAADAAAAAAAEAARVANTPDGARAQAREIAASQFGWGADQFQCLDSLWTKESNWRVEASNGSSGATGIPQALPGSKMATVAADWQTSARTQIIWGLGYIKGSYGSPCSAWSHSQSMNWY